MPAPKAAAEPHFVQKQRLNRAEKRAITRAALGFVNDGDTVAFSAGTTTWQIAESLERGQKSLTFVTNSTNIALTLQENGWEQIVLSGGMFRTPSDALVGPFADRTLRTVKADVLFLGVHGIHPDAGLTRQTSPRPRPMGASSRRRRGSWWSQITPSLASWRWRR